MLCLCKIHVKYIYQNLDRTESNNVKLRNLFLRKSTFQDHFEAQNKDVHKYAACTIALLKNNIHLGQHSKALAVAFFWSE